MSLLFLDGFDDRATGTTAILEKPGWSVRSGASIAAALGRLGTQGCDLTANNRIIRWEASDSPAITQTDSVIYFGMGIRPLTNGGAVDGFLYLFNAAEAVNHLTVNFESDKTMVVKRGSHSGTELGRSSVIDMPLDVYHYFEFKFTISDTVGTIDIWRDGVNILTDTGLDTRNGGTDQFIDRIDFQGANSFTYYTDDIYIGNSVGSDFAAPLVGDFTIETLFPTAEGTPINWTPSTGGDNSALIDEQPGWNDDTDYNSTSTVTDIDDFDYENLADNTVDIKGIQVMTRARKTDAGAISFRNRVDSGASIGNGIDQSLSTDWGVFSDPYEVDPQGGGAWTGARIEAAEYGYECRT